MGLLGPSWTTEMHTAQHMLSHSAVLFETRWTEPSLGFMRHLSQYQHSPEASTPFTLHGSFQPRQVQFVLAKVTGSVLAVFRFCFVFFLIDDFLLCTMKMNISWITQKQGEKHWLLRYTQHPFAKNQVGIRQCPIAINYHSSADWALTSTLNFIVP